MDTKIQPATPLSAETFSRNMESVLIVLYFMFTIAKVMQWMMHVWFTKFNNDSNKPERISYIPSLQAAISMVHLIAATSMSGSENQSNIADIPRKEYQTLTDPMLKSYTKNYGTLPKGRVFRSIEEAKRNFFTEFSSRSDYMTWFLCSSIGPLARAQIAAPLGLTWFLYVVPWFCFSSAALINEKWNGGNIMTWTLHVAVALTITDVYIVCCKENLTWEEGIHKYKWFDIFSKEQIHPLIGTHICPMYKRTVIFPPDKMDFDIEVVETKSSLLAIREKKKKEHSWQYRNVILLLSVTTVLSLCYFLSFQVSRFDVDVEELSRILSRSCQKVAPSAILFYVIRFAVDHAMGTSWEAPWTL